MYPKGAAEKGHRDAVIRLVELLAAKKWAAKMMRQKDSRGLTPVRLIFIFVRVIMKCVLDCCACARVLVLQLHLGAKDPILIGVLLDAAGEGALAEDIFVCRGGTSEC